MRATSIEPSDVVDAYRAWLLRDPLPCDVATFVAGAPDVVWLAGEMRRSTEYRTIVAPLRELLEAEWEFWALRPPTAEELRRCVDATRGRCRDDDGLRRALADGSIRHRLGFRPLKIELDITNQCNLRCVMCHFSLPDYHDVRRQHLTVEQFARIASQLFHRAHHVSLSYGTEPLLHRDLAALLEELRRHGVPHTYLHTNGQLLTEAIVEAMIDTGFSLLFVSVDAATAPTYEAIRIGGSFTRLRKNLDMLRAVKARRGSEAPELTLGFVIMRRNLHELPAMIDFAVDVGATSVNATHMVTFASVGNAGLAVHDDKQRCNEMLAATRERAAQRGIRFVSPAPFALGGPATRQYEKVARARDLGITGPALSGPGCPFPWGFVAIDPRGDVQPCGWWDGALAKPMGNVLTTDFATIWRGEEYRALRERLRQGRREGPCSQCPAAGLGDVDSPSAFQPGS